jgi:hypothetical protein
MDPNIFPEQSPPPSVITPTNQSGVLIITAALTLTLGLVSLVIRGYVRYEFSHAFGTDDALAVVAFVRWIV